jgi:uncharacterized protein (TIGR03086 family)
MFATAVQIATPIIAGVRHDQLDLPTTCGGFDVKGLLDHLVSVLNRVTAFGTGESESAKDGRNDDWAAHWQVLADKCDAVWSDDALLGRDIVLPWTTMTGAEMLATYAAEITTHTWDLATPTGQHPAWDDAVCQLGLDAMRRELPMADRTPMWESFRANIPAGAEFQFDAPFANAVAVSSNASLIDLLVAWSGRRP